MPLKVKFKHKGTIVTEKKHQNNVVYCAFVFKS